MKLLKKTVLAFLILLASGVLVVSAANAQALFKNQGALRVLGIDILESLKPSDSVSTETLGSVIEAVTGTKVIPNSTSAEDVCDAYAQALGYKHLAGGDGGENYLEYQLSFQECMRRINILV